MKKPPITKFISLDLEMNQPSNSIIQIGVAIGDIESKSIIETACIHVHQNEQITNYIQKLTGIAQQDVDNGISILDAYSQLEKLIVKHQPFINPITWGGGDSECLKQQLYSFCRDNNLPQPETWIFGRRWIDVKTLFVSWRFANLAEIQGGLSRSMVKVGLRFQGRAHNAKDDAVNTFYMYCALLEKLKHKI
jgi:inhibitor of KinA sporulation pathway (predicted exonuclease)